MGEEVGTMQIRVLGEIKKMNKIRGQKNNPKYLTCQKEKKRKKTRKRKRKNIE
jgi:hypothetical protein